MDPSPHPDLVWLAPPGAQHMIDDVRERVIRASAYRPFEGGRRIFVVEAAESLRDESQNALLKTLEEPPRFAHLILLCSEPEALLETIASRCEVVAFSPLPPAAIAESLGLLGERGAGTDPTAAARLAAGDLERARFLLSEEGSRIRDQAQACAAAAVAGELGGAPWRALLAGAEAVGEEAEAEARERLQEEADAAGRRSAREVTDGAKRAGRRRRTEVLDLGLELSAAWLRDLAAVAAGAPAVAFNSDRLEELSRQAAGMSPGPLLEGVRLVQETRRGLDLNVSEELALEALFFRLESLLASR
jgi:DNA polymerase-3 subunit delta'